jgi:hypothetical protein
MKNLSYQHLKNKIGISKRIFLKPIFFMSFSRFVVLVLKIIGLLRTVLKRTGLGEAFGGSCNRYW